MLQKIVCFHIQVVFAQLYCYDHRESDDAIVTVYIIITQITMPVGLYRCQFKCILVVIYMNILIK